MGGTRYMSAARMQQTFMGIDGSGTYRYWRLRVTSTQAAGTGADDNFAVAGIEFRTEPNGPVLSSGKTYASSSDTGADNNAEKAFDGDSTTFLDTSGTSGWVSVDFGSKVKVGSVSVENVPNATRKAIKTAVVEFSSNNTDWTESWDITFPDWTDSQQTVTENHPSVQADLQSTTSWGTLAAGVECKGAWGTILRNPDYTGPAMKVENAANPGETVDVSFNAEGVITQAPPYGVDTRVIALYDQVGTCDVFALYTDDIRIIQSYLHSTWVIDFNNKGMFSTELTDGTRAWELDNPTFLASFYRRSSTSEAVFGVSANGSGNNRSFGIAYNSSPYAGVKGAGNNISGADFSGDMSEKTKIVKRFLADCDGNSVRIYYQGVLKRTDPYSSPVTYNAGRALSVGGAQHMDDMVGGMVECALLSSGSALTPDQISDIDEAMKQGEYLPKKGAFSAGESSLFAVSGTPRELTVSPEHCEYVISGQNGAHNISRTQALYTALAPLRENVSGYYQEGYGIMAPNIDLISSANNSIHVIVNN